jgi:hypothetical protein
LLGRLGPHAAILCASDLLALGALRAVRHRGLEPGRDVGVVGFDDSDVAEALQLTSLRQPLREAAAEAWRIVHEKGTHLALTALLAPTLTVRESTFHGDTRLPAPTSTPAAHGSRPRSRPARSPKPPAKPRSSDTPRTAPPTPEESS